jgi:hypothetical protein
MDTAMKPFASIYRTQIGWKTIVLVMIFTKTWGANMAFVKILALVSLGMIRVNYRL